MDFSFNVILLLVFHFLAASAVSKDCRAKGIEKKDSFVILTFFFPVITGIVYACKRKKYASADLPENSAGFASSAKFLSVIAVIALIASGVVGTMSMSNSDPMITNKYDIIKYDRNGDAYFFNQKINYYDREGNVYQMTDTNSEFVNTETNEKYEYYNCVVDSDGYFLLVDGDNYEIIGDNIVSYEGHSYLLAMRAKWDRDGLLYDSWGNQVFLP